MAARSRQMRFRRSLRVLCFSNHVSALKPKPPIRENRLFYTYIVRKLKPPIRPPPEKSSEAHTESFTVSYLVNSCGLSRNSALYAARRVNFTNPRKPDSVLAFLRTHGFNDSQISGTVKGRPSILLSKPEKTLLPKLGFLKSVGFSDADIPMVVCRQPMFLSRSLEKTIKPAYNSLKSVVLSDENVCVLLKNNCWIFLGNFTEGITRVVDCLRESQVPQRKIVHFMTRYPQAVFSTRDQLRGTLHELKQMGLKPLNPMFTLALHVMLGRGNRLMWNRSFETYAGWGLSRDEILLAFMKQPLCMLMSAEKINHTIEFVVNHTGYDCSDIVACPSIMCYSLEKRIIPRCNFLHLLSSKHVLKKDVKLSYLLALTEKMFVEKFVRRYEDELPQVWDVYRGGKLDVLGV